MNKTSVFLDPITDDEESLDNQWRYVTEETAEHMQVQLFMCGAKNFNNSGEWSNEWGFDNAYGYGMAGVLARYENKWVAFTPAWRDDGTLIHPDVWREENEDPVS